MFFAKGKTVFFTQTINCGLVDVIYKKVNRVIHGQNIHLSISQEDFVEVLHGLFIDELLERQFDLFFYCDDFKYFFKEHFSFFVIAACEGLDEVEVLFFLLDVLLIALLGLENFGVNFVFCVYLLQGFCFDLKDYVVQEGNPDKYDLWWSVGCM
jgi:hypothetical protein